MLIDDTDGLRAMRDNFDFLDERTREPVLSLLTKNL